MSVSAIKREAARRGVEWQTVQDVFAELRRLDFNQKDYPNEIRRFAWYCVTANEPRCQQFWRLGFASRYGKRVEKSDYTAIPGYDLILQEVASKFPEFSHADGESRLFDFLFSDYVPYRPLSDVWAEALDIATAAQLAETAVCASTADDF